MEFSPTQAQAELQRSVREIAKHNLGESLERRDAASEFSRGYWGRCAQFGIQGLPFPEQYGGQGADILTTVLALEALGESTEDSGLLFSIGAHIWAAGMPLLAFGTSEQKDRLLPGICSGSLIAANAITEPEAGSDAMSLTSSLRHNGDAYLLSGSKQFITNAPEADLFLVFATVDPSLGWAGLTAVLVERDQAGLTVGPPVHKMGTRTSPMSSIYFDDVQIDESQLLGPVGAGMSVFRRAMLLERCCIMAPVLGTMKRQLDAIVEYTGQRCQFGKPIREFGAVSQPMADMAMRLEACRLLSYRGAALADAGELTADYASMIKCYVSDSYIASSLSSLDLYGGYGYMCEAGVERDIRDALGSRIYSGTNHIQRDIVARALWS